MHIPPQSLTAFEGIGVDPQRFREAVCYHEAAHVAVALHFGGTVDRIEMTSSQTASTQSTARAIWKAGKAGMNEIFTAIAAGPACDQIMNQTFGFPVSLLQSVADKEKKIFLDIFRRNVPQVDPKYGDDLWQDYLKAAIDILCLDRVKAFHQLLADHVIAADKKHQVSISQQEIMSLWSGYQDKESRQQSESTRSAGAAEARNVH